VYDYFPRAPTLFEKYFVAPKRATSPEDVHIPESLMWSFVIQILSIMKTIHTAGMALRVLDLTNVLLTNQNRLVYWISIGK
jgi:PAB-dependent poly(A)-specific ribonuclease subunit 3